MDIAKFTNKFLETTTTADISVDANANVDDVSILSWNYEFPKPLMKLNGLYFLWKDALKKHGIKRANKMIELEIAGGIRIHDLHGWMMPYCYATSLAPIVYDGMPWVKNIKVKPVKHFLSLINNSIKYIYSLSTQCVGAIAVPDFLVFAEYFIRKDFGEEWYEETAYVELIEQLFQHWIYSVNDKARGNQSPFTNVSVFDKYWREAMFGEHTNPDFSKCDLDNLKRVQRLFVKVLIEQQKDNPFTFPVMTACQLKDEKTGEILDKDWLDWIGEISVENKLMNFYTSETCDSLSSCLASGNVITVFNKQLNITEILTIETFVHRFISKENTDQHIDISNYTIKAWNIVTGEEEIVNIIAVLKKLNISKKLITIKTNTNNLTVSPDHKIAVKYNNEIHYITANELIELQDNVQLQICELVNGIFEWNNIISIETQVGNLEDNNVYCIELDKLHYFAANNIISHNCCRLRNNLNGTQKSEYTNSFGVGGLNIGSHRVVALNLPQIAYIAKYSDKNDLSAFYNILESRIKIAQDILDIHRELLMRLIDNGNLPMYKHGCMDLSKQYSTLGFIGLYECMEILGMSILTDEGLKESKNIINLFNKLNADRTAKDGRIRNVEQIPGESAAVTFALKDKLQFANTNDYDLYANQYIPLIKESLMTDRIRLQGEFDSNVSGGSILHIDIDQELTKEQIIDVIQLCAKNNVIYFALDDCLSQCVSCGKVHVGKFDKSPCHNAKMKYFMRVVGFRTPVSSWAKVRRTKDFPRRYLYHDTP